MSAASRTPAFSRVAAGFGARQEPLTEERVGSGTMLAKVDPSTVPNDKWMRSGPSRPPQLQRACEMCCFGYDSWTISEDGRQALSRDAEWMKSNPSALVKVEGHRDERGTAAYNLVLGEKRAKAAWNYLVELGVGANRLSVVSYGKERPSCNEQCGIVLPAESARTSCGEDREVGDVLFVAVVVTPLSAKERAGDSFIIDGWNNVELFGYKGNLGGDLCDLCPVVDRLHRPTS